METHGGDYVRTRTTNQRPVELACWPPRVPYRAVRTSNPSHHCHARLLHEARHWHGVGLVGGEAARVPEEHLFRNQDPERDEPPPKVKPQFGSTKFQKLALAFADRTLSGYPWPLRSDSHAHEDAGAASLRADEQDDSVDDRYIPDAPGLRRDAKQTRRDGVIRLVQAEATTAGAAGGLGAALGRASAEDAEELDGGARGGGGGGGGRATQLAQTKRAGGGSRGLPTPRLRRPCVVLKVNRVSVEGFKDVFVEYDVRYLDGTVQTIDMSWNSVRGSLPAQIFQKLPNLVELRVEGSNIGGCSN